MHALKILSSHLAQAVDYLKDDNIQQYGMFLPNIGIFIAMMIETRIFFSQKTECYYINMGSCEGASSKYQLTIQQKSDKLLQNTAKLKLNGCKIKIKLMGKDLKMR